jgi:ribosomal protein L13E
MGKRSRSKFTRSEKDFYPTPRKAVPTLLPWLKRERIRTFAEPCAGRGHLMRALEEHGLQCRYAGDIAASRDELRLEDAPGLDYYGEIAYGQDALALDSYGEIDAIITNPPFVKPLMHELIVHFPAIAPTWLLLEWDWSANEHAGPSCPPALTSCRSAGSSGCRNPSTTAASLTMAGTDSAPATRAGRSFTLAALRRTPVRAVPASSAAPLTDRSAPTLGFARMPAASGPTAHVVAVTQP